MNSRTKLGMWTLLGVILLVVAARFVSIDTSRTFTFEFKSNPLRKIVQGNLAGKEGAFAVYVEDLQDGEKYDLDSHEIFPAASLYKLVLVAAVLERVEKGELKMEEAIFATKAHLTEVFGSEDFGYQEAPEEIEYTIEEALIRVGRISDNFAAIMLTEKLRTLEKTTDPLAKMAKELGMDNTKFTDGPTTTTASDIAVFFRDLYMSQVVSKAVSDKIFNLLSLSKINDRIPAKLPGEVKSIHKSGELPRVRHDAGIVYLGSHRDEASDSGLPRRAYLIVMLSKDLKYEDDGVETLAELSKEVYEYFQAK